jgi:hypothetical protein
LISILLARYAPMPGSVNSISAKSGLVECCIRPSLDDPLNGRLRIGSLMNRRLGNAHNPLSS